MGTDNMGKVHLDVWGDFAIFTRPEFKIERYSYDVPTPSSMRNLLQSIYWHPSMQYQITGITVYNEIRHIAMTRNEMDTMMNSSMALKTLESVNEHGFGKSLSVPFEEPRQQRMTVYLQDVHYGIDAEILPSRIMPEGCEKYDIKKFLAIFNRRAEKGQCFSYPYLGIKECVASFAPHRYESNPEPFHKGRKMDLGMMFFDSSYSLNDNVQPYFFHAAMENGHVKIPTQKEVMSNAAFVAD